jgi:hypothetical protein
MGRVLIAAAAVVLLIRARDEIARVTSRREALERELETLVR